jgi:ubiquitin 3 binding protein But2-like protein
MKFITSLLPILTFAAAAPAPQIPGSGAVITPSDISQYQVSTGAINFNVANGKIARSSASGDTTTLLTFNYPAAAAGKTCAIHFYLSSGSTLSGTKTFDVFSSLQPATHSTTSFPPGNQRNQQIGRLSVNLGSEATYEAGFPQAAAAFPCPAAGTAYGYEFAPNGDFSDIEWVQGGSVGAYVTYA